MDGESGQVVFANTNLGAGAWTEIEAPVNISPTGGYAAGGSGLPRLQLPDRALSRRHELPLPGRNPAH